MKDLRECGEVGPSENGEIMFSCLFCGDKLDAMELIVQHINALHKDKITFEPEALKKRPRRKRKSELPVSEWIHLEKEKKRRPGRTSIKKSSKKSSSDTDVKVEHEGEENSKPEDNPISRLTEEDTGVKKLEKNQYSRSRRKISQIKVENKENDSERVPKLGRGKKRGRKKKDNFTIITTESEEEIPIKIRLKRRGKEIVIENETTEQNTEKQKNSIENIKIIIDKTEVENNKCIFENELIIVPEKLLEGNEQPIETKTKINLDLKSAEESNSQNEIMKVKEETSNLIKNEEEKQNYAIKTEVKMENDNSLKVEENLNILQQILDAEQNGEFETSDSDDEFLDNFSVSISQNNNSDSDDDNTDSHDQPVEESSSSDSDSEKISALMEKLRKKNVQINENTQENENLMSLTQQQSKNKNDSDLQEDLQKKNIKNISETTRKKRRKLKCTPKTRKMNEFGEYVCDLCGNTYKKATSLSRHRADCREGKTITPRVRTRKENGLFPCTYENCLAEFPNVEDVFKHEKEVHGKKKYARPQIRKRNEFGEYVCDICGNVYKKGTSLSRHRALCREGIVVVPKRKKRDRMRNEKGMYQCAFHSCGFEFSKVEDAIAHEKQTHKGGKKKKIGRMCEVCGKWLTSACSFKSHMLRHSGERNYKCDQCSGAFYDKYALTLHKKVHTDMKEYECEFCQKKFTRAPEMRKHIRYIHLNMRPDPVMCDLCGKYFHWKFDLKSHMRRHYNVKTIRCEFAECEQMFANRSDLKKHLITHNPDIKPWQCEICSNSFSRKSTLVKHQKLHTGTKDYTCSICGKAFAQSPGLYMHMKSHGFNLKPEGAGRYERISHLAYRQMDPDRISNLNFKQNNEVNAANAENIQINVEIKDASDILNQQNNNNFQHINSEMHGDEDSKNSLNEKLIQQHKDNQTTLEIPANQIATIHIESIQGVLTTNLITNPTITAIGNEIQINLGRPIQIDLGHLSHAPNH